MTEALNGIGPSAFRAIPNSQFARSDAHSKNFQLTKPVKQMINFLLVISRRLCDLIRKKNRGAEATSSENASHSHSTVADDDSADVFDIKNKHIWSDDVAAECRGGTRFREDERFPPRNRTPKEDKK